LTLEIITEQYPICGQFTIARGTKTTADIVLAQITHRGQLGRGECVPYARYGETVQSVVSTLQLMRPQLDFSHMSLQQIHENVLENMPAGAARNALDCALWDLNAKLSGITVANRLKMTMQPVVTAYTLSLGDPAQMGQQAKLHAHLPLLKIKVGSGSIEQDCARIQAVRANAPASRLIVDANEGWTIDTIEQGLTAAAAYDVALVEQPLPASQDSFLQSIPHKVAIYADETIHTCQDLPRLHGLYDGINIKLDKSGGLSEALKLKQQAKQAGFGIMVGCMVATSLAMAPAVMLAQGADFVDLDGPLLLAQDRDPALFYEQCHIYPPSPDLWG